MNKKSCAASSLRFPPSSSISQRFSGFERALDPGLRPLAASLPEA
jgi:hypothetical protein